MLARVDSGYMTYTSVYALYRNEIFPASARLAFILALYLGECMKIYVLHSDNTCCIVCVSTNLDTIKSVYNDREGDIMWIEEFEDGEVQ